MNLWRFNNVTGYWILVKQIEIVENAETWLAIFEKDEPIDQFGCKNHFKLSKTKPRKRP